MKRSFVSALVLVAALFSAIHATAQDLGNSLKVDRVEFPVTVGDGLMAPADCRIVGYLYYHGSYRGRPLQVVVHGATYNHTYWDFPSVGGEDYSYARYMAHPDRKYAVLAIDQLAAGESCKPQNGLAVTLDETASALNQVIRQLRSGSNETGHAFGEIVLVGHSAGAINAILVQAKYGAADALVVTAATHLTSLPLSPGVQTVLPFVDFLASLPYFQLPAEMRSSLFYAPSPLSDPNVVQLDNATADVWTGGQVTTTFAAFLYPGVVPIALDRVNEVSGPVLIQMGDADALFPAGLATHEASLWTNADVTIQTLSGIGHNFNLHANRRQSWDNIDAWLQQTLAK